MIDYNEDVFVPGEYVLVRVDHPQLKLDVQGRFEQVPRNVYGAVNATHLTSIVAASNNSVPIEVNLTSKEKDELVIFFFAKNLISSI